MIQKLKSDPQNQDPQSFGSVFIFPSDWTVFLWKSLHVDAGWSFYLNHSFWTVSCFVASESIKCLSILSLFPLCKASSPNNYIFFFCRFKCAIFFFFFFFSLNKLLKQYKTIWLVSVTAASAESWAQNIETWHRSSDRLLTVWLISCLRLCFTNVWISNRFSANAKKQNKTKEASHHTFSLLSTSHTSSLHTDLVTSVHGRRSCLYFILFSLLIHLRF